MIRLRDEIKIKTAPEKVYDWFLHLEDNYLSWHPDHVSCKYLKGRNLEDGSVLYAEEYLHGRLHKLKFTLSEIKPGREFEYRMFPGAGGAFRIKPTDEGTDFVAEIDIGSSMPVIGALLDFFLRIFFSDHLDAVRQHMREEGVNLKNLLDSKQHPAH